MNEKLIEKIISVAYGDAGFADRLYINIMALKDKEVKMLLAEYRNTAREVHAINEEELSEDTVKQIYAKAGIKPAGRLSFAGDMFSFFYTRPLVATASAFVLIALLVTTIFIKNRQPEITYSQEQIEQAGRQTKEVFAAINEVFSNAGTLVKDDVLKDRVAKPLNESYNKITRILKEGEIQ